MSSDVFTFAPGIAAEQFEFTAAKMREPDKMAKVFEHVQYLGPDWIARVGRLEAEAVGFDGCGWYFWDETRTQCYGPYANRTLAVLKCTEYVKKILET